MSILIFLCTRPLGILLYSLLLVISKYGTESFLMFTLRQLKTVGTEIDTF